MIYTLNILYFMNHPLLIEIINTRLKIINYFKSKYKVSFDDAEGTFTDGMITMIETINTNPTATYIIPYFYTILHNAFKYQYNIKKTNRIKEAEEIFYTDNYNEQDQAKQVYQRISVNEFWDTIEQFMLSRYTIKQFNIFRAKYKYNHSQKFIAIQYGKSEATISVLLRKMILDLREEFTDNLQDMVNSLL